MREFVVEADWADQTLSVPRCEWNDRLGGFVASANWSRRTNAGNCDGRSSLDLKGLFEAANANKALADVTFNSPPVSDLSGWGACSGVRPPLDVVRHAAVGEP